MLFFISLLTIKSSITFGTVYRALYTLLEYYAHCNPTVGTKLIYDSICALFPIYRDYNARMSVDFDIPNIKCSLLHEEYCVVQRILYGATIYAEAI
jgi:hypothetical protein